MPIFEYVCNDCNHKFEQLVMNGSTSVKCKSCEGENLRKLFSVFASSSGGGEVAFDGGPGCGRCGSLERRCE